MAGYKPSSLIKKLSKKKERGQYQVEQAWSLKDLYRYILREKGASGSPERAK